jgi:integrase
MSFNLIDLSSRVSVTGSVFDINSDLWEIDGIHSFVSFDFTKIRKVLANENLIEGFKLTISWYLMNKSVEHAANLFYRMYHFFKFIRNNRDSEVEEIKSLHLINYRSSLAPNQAWYIGAMAGLIFKWFDLGLQGVSKDAVNFLKQIKKPGNKKGEAVLTLDSLDGPFTSIEIDAIQVELRNSYNSKLISIRSYLLAQLFMTLGVRPSQVSLLRLSDVVFTTDKEGTPTCLVRVPRVKQRGAIRDQFTPRFLTPVLGESMLKYSQELALQFNVVTGDQSCFPLFPKLGSKGTLFEGQFSLSIDLGNELRKVLDSLRVFSERTGEQIRITATRFRRTLGTRAAEEGHGELIIAALLDHTDTQNVGVYTQATPTMVDRIDKAMAFQMAPLAQAFAGKVASTSKKSQLSKQQYSAVINPEIDPTCGEMGGCGSHSHCNYSAPVACYTCVSFTAWDDGPHEQVLDYLLAERERKIAQSDLRIASINDRAILAVAEVIKRCQQLKSIGQEI